MSTVPRDAPGTGRTPYGAADGTYNDYATAGSGWVDFAAVMLGFAGIWNALNGILAIADSRVFVNEALFVFSNLNTWGWIMLALGVLQVLAAAAIVQGSEWARWFGIVVAALNAMGQLYFLPAFPLWAMAMFAVDILIIYGLAAYGGKQLRPAA
jgi:hypothetical protein